MTASGKREWNFCRFSSASGKPRLYLPLLHSRDKALFNYALQYQPFDVILSVQSTNSNLGFEKWSL